MKVKPLPDKLSDLLELAVNDCKKLKKTPGYILNMGTWHEPVRGAGKRKPVCRVCMAGAIMACELGIPRNHESRPDDFDPEDCSKLGAIDEMRNGHFDQAAHEMGHVSLEYHLAGELKIRVRANWMEKDRRAPWSVYETCVKVLREYNL
jgi:hypothetical protein